MSLLKVLLRNKHFNFNAEKLVFQQSGDRKLSNDVNNEITEKVESGGFAKSYEKFENIKDHNKSPPAHQTFASLLKNSKFIDVGDPEGKIVNGKIFHVVDDDLYIDFGWKFHCVCPKPKKNSSDFVKGAMVRLRIKDLELSTKFLGFDKDLTLLEADCTLLGLIQDRIRSTPQ
ncbi:unnamed protein product [Phaedon cochleariae]|uniref:28S ribosomal protein S28, mitochondrial n=1 Tax=Phaedon cochleariae TaxID=80249 RepID=A0A9P0DTV6_PHACE|nr:unnamed protein product [Phaedon cochleariae]